MGAIYDAFKQAWPFGPSSNPTEPNKADIHNAGATIDREVEGATAGLVRGELWVTLNAITGTRNGQPGEVPTTDGGTHTDPVAGGTVPNQGEYRWSSSPVGWRRIGDYQNVASKADQADLIALASTVESKADANEMGLGFRKMAVVQLINVSGTGNSVSADVPDDVDTARWAFSSGALVSLRWPVANSVGNPTLTVADVNATYVITLSGEAGRVLEPGELKAGGDYLVVFAGNNGSAAVGRVLNVQSTAVQNEIDQVVASQEIGRPGDAPYAWSNVVTGLPEDRIPLSGPVTVAGANGRVLRVVGVNSIAPRARYRLDPVRKYLVRFAYSRPQNVADPAGAAVQCALSWLQASGAAHPATPLTVGHSEAPTTGDGRRLISLVIASVAGADVDFVWPAGAIYCTPFIQTFQADAVTDLEMIEWTDITDVGGYSPDLTSLESRVGAIESEDLPDRVATLEADVATPAIARFATRADAIAATIPASAEIVEVSAYSVSHPVVKTTYVRAAGSTPGGWQNVADSQWWAVGDAVSTFEAFGAKGDGIASDQAAYVAALALGKPIERLSGRTYLVTDPANPNGVSIHGAGKVVVAAYGKQRQVTTYADGDARYSLGREYLWKLTERLNGYAPVNCVITGDSTIAMDLGVTIHGLLEDLTAARGFSRMRFTNTAVSGSTWRSLDIPAMVESDTHVLICKFGINDGAEPAGDGDMEVALPIMRDAIHEQLNDLRTSTYGGVENLTIILMGPSSTDDPVSNRASTWYEAIRGIYVEAARVYKCMYFDTYGYMRDSVGFAGLSLDNPYGDGRGVHPLPALSRLIFGGFIDAVTEGLDDLRDNRFVNRAYDDGIAPSASQPLSAWSRGLSVVRTSADAGYGGYPFPGLVTTVRQPDGTGWQRIDDYQRSYPVSRTRNWNVSGAAWSNWSGELISLSLQNSWVAYGGTEQVPSGSRTADGLVTLQGSAKSGTTTDGTVIANLPVGYRPGGDLSFVSSTFDATTQCIIQVKANGDVIGAKGLSSALTSLSGVTFRAA